MRILILGGDGYLGWPTAMHFAAKGFDVCVVDNYLRRTLAQQTQSEALLPTPNLNRRAEIFGALTGKEIQVEIGDCQDYRFLSRVVSSFQPEAVIHYAEIPSAPYSMMGFDEARLTLNNNLNSTFNLVHAILKHAPDCHIVKLGTMGEYGTPNIDIEEGWIDIEHNGRSDRFLFPRAGGSLYHTTKIFDTDMLWFYVRMYNLRVTDLMQGPVYGLSTPEAELDEALTPNFHYDDIFGTVINRFLVQAVKGIPLTVYGTGEQKKGYLNLRDTLQCVELAVQSPAEEGELRVMNQITELFTINEIAHKISEVGNEMGLQVQTQTLENPRIEQEVHHFMPKHSKLLDLGLEPNFMTNDEIACMLEKVLAYKSEVVVDKIMPRINWHEYRNN